LSAFNTLVLDVDSTLCGVEGIDWLAKRKGASIAKNVESLTARAMAGEIPLESVYGERLALVAPTRDDLAALGEEYVRALAPGAAGVIKSLLALGVSVHLISGGLHPAVSVAAERIGVPALHVHAVHLSFDDDGGYSAFDSISPLTTQSGKREVVSALAGPRPVLLVGDGMTDAEARPAVDAFAAFTGFVRRDPAVARADYVVSTFDEILELVTG